MLMLAVLFASHDTLTLPASIMSVGKVCESLSRSTGLKCVASPELESIPLAFGRREWDAQVLKEALSAVTVSEWISDKNEELLRRSTSQSARLAQDREDSILSEYEKAVRHLPSQTNDAEATERIVQGLFLANAVDSQVSIDDMFALVDKLPRTRMFHGLGRSLPRPDIGQMKPDSSTFYSSRAMPEAMPWPRASSILEKFGCEQRLLADIMSRRGFLDSDKGHFYSVFKPHIEAAAIQAGTPATAIARVFREGRRMGITILVESVGSTNSYEHNWMVSNTVPMARWTTWIASNEGSLSKAPELSSTSRLVLNALRSGEWPDLSRARTALRGLNESGQMPGGTLLVDVATSVDQLLDLPVVLWVDAHLLQALASVDANGGEKTSDYLVSIAKNAAYLVDESRARIVFRPALVLDAQDNQPRWTFSNDHGSVASVLSEAVSLSSTSDAFLSVLFVRSALHGRIPPFGTAALRGDGAPGLRLATVLRDHVRPNQPKAELAFQSLGRAAQRSIQDFVSRRHLSAEAGTHDSILIPLATDFRECVVELERSTGIGLVAEPDSHGWPTYAATPRELASQLSLAPTADVHDWRASLNTRFRACAIVPFELMTIAIRIRGFRKFVFTRVFECTSGTDFVAPTTMSAADLERLIAAAQ